MSRDYTPSRDTIGDRRRKRSGVALYREFNEGSVEVMGSV